MSGVPAKRQSGRERAVRSGDRRRQAGGFTLIEIMVVLVVISIISSMGVRSVIAALQMSRERHTEAEILAMVNAVKLYKSDTEACVPGEDENDFRNWLVANNFFDQVQLLDGWGRRGLPLCAGRLGWLDQRGRVQLIQQAQVNSKRKGTAKLI